MPTLEIAERDLNQSIDTLIERNKQEYVDGVEGGRVSVQAVAQKTVWNPSRVEEIARESDKFRTDRISGKLWIEKVVESE
ncbi:MAG: hypothetical protein ABEJ03_03195 [Candidatus Nanohaloarchaea archaeon]